MKIDLTNPWHKVGIGENAPERVNGIIEIPKNTERNKNWTKNREW